MSRKLAPSLASYFIPSRGFKGEFGLVAGYSADAEFFNDALEKFTLNMKGQRSYQGGISLTLMLDPNHVQISPIACPGLLHLAFKHDTTKQFKLLHSKVALLTFKAIESEEQFIRLIVSTGNWTRQTLEDSLDLVWSIDVVPGNKDEQGKADILAAYHFFNDILRHFDTAILTDSGASKLKSYTHTQYARFHKLFDEVVVEDSIKPRFFDNRSASLLDQLPALVKHHCSEKKRDYLSLGSGFYEGGSSDAVPSVINSLHLRLIDESLLSKNADKNIIVNQHGCQSIASSLNSLKDNNWQVLKAYDPLYQGGKMQRSLHAKFIFSAKSSETTDECKSAWVYLGSGNLTGPGFTKKASKFGGNIEAGVVFEAKGITWVGEENPETALSLKLPLCFDSDYALTDTSQLSGGSEMPEHEAEHISLPISYFVLEELEHDKYALVPNTPFTDAFTVVNAGADKLTIKSEACLLWFGKPPRQLTVSWCNNSTVHTEDIPVIDQYGRVAATELPELALDDAWYMFSAFPLLPSFETEGYEGDEGDGASDDGQVKGAEMDVEVDKRYSINTMMVLIELIAEKQTEVSEKDWIQWCTRLEQTFSQLKSSSAFTFFKNIAINPISPLWQPPFRPDFAESNATELGAYYEEVLKRLELKLGLAALAKLGE